MYEYFSVWRNDGTWQRILDILGKVAREHAEPQHEATLTAASIDSRSVKTTPSAGDRGYDGAKKIIERKYTIVVDTLELILAIAVMLANLKLIIQDNLTI